MGRALISLIINKKPWNKPSLKSLKNTTTSLNTIEARAAFLKKTNNRKKKILELTSLGPRESQRRLSQISIMGTQELIRSIVCSEKKWTDPIPLHQTSDWCAWRSRRSPPWLSLSLQTLAAIVTTAWRAATMPKSHTSTTPSLQNMPKSSRKITSKTIKQLLVKFNRKAKRFKIRAKRLQTLALSSSSSNTSRTKLPNQQMRKLPPILQVPRFNKILKAPSSQLLLRMQEKRFCLYRETTFIQIKLNQTRKTTL